MSYSICVVVADGIHTRPNSIMLAYSCEYCRVLAPAKLGKIAYAAANWLVWPLRCLDVWPNRKPNRISWRTPFSSSRRRSGRSPVSLYRTLADYNGGLDVFILICVGLVNGFEG